MSRWHTEMSSTLLQPQLRTVPFAHYVGKYIERRWRYHSLFHFSRGRKLSTVFTFEFLLFFIRTVFFFFFCFLQIVLLYSASCVQHHTHQCVIHSYTSYPMDKFGNAYGRRVELINTWIGRGRYTYLFISIIFFLSAICHAQWHEC